ncbi:hypothetical protein H2200_013272 [Cladophialophora chaetospira]|uniref:Uncharacterized protein n=1 Tax=Cladophialophora chaetospira TaxID=386627 RepID=A0AA38WPF7_9EURO|nr:hypothetical protein H2200_013272 [Cladophialophora chaetospira]
MTQLARKGVEEKVERYGGAEERSLASPPLWPFHSKYGSKFCVASWSTDEPLDYIQHLSSFQNDVQHPSTFSLRNLTQPPPPLYLPPARAQGLREWTITRCAHLPVYTTILETCRQLYAEGFPLLYKHNTFVVTILFQRAYPYFQTVAAECFDLVRQPKFSSVIKNMERLMIKIAAIEDFQNGRLYTGGPSGQRRLCRGQEFVRQFCRFSLAPCSASKRIIVQLKTPESLGVQLLSDFNYIRCREITFMVDGQPDYSALGDSVMTRFPEYKAAIESQAPILDVPPWCETVDTFLPSIAHQDAPGFRFAYEMMQTAAAVWNVDGFMRAAESILSMTEALPDQIWAEQVQKVRSIIFSERDAGPQK